MLTHQPNHYSLATNNTVTTKNQNGSHFVVVMEILALINHWVQLV